MQATHTQNAAFAHAKPRKVTLPAARAYLELPAKPAKRMLHVGRRVQLPRNYNKANSL